MTKTEAVDAYLDHAFNLVPHLPPRPALPLLLAELELANQNAAAIEAMPDGPAREAEAESLAADLRELLDQVDETWSAEERAAALAA